MNTKTAFNIALNLQTLREQRSIKSDSAKQLRKEIYDLSIKINSMEKELLKECLKQ